MKCGKPIRNEEEEFCPDCRKRKFSYEQGRSLWLHREPVSRAVYDFKFHNKRIYGDIFAKECVRVYSGTLKKWQIKEIIPVPLHPAKRRRRGYNQAELLADGIGRRMGIPVNAECIYRIKKTIPQKKFDGRARRKNIASAFAIDAEWEPAGNVLIVDDIYTTGSTVEEITKLLKKRGAQKVYFLTISIGQGL
ncbi:comF family protein [Hespellia stercorisuis DSM 15480]|uniref:ComF family protein n=2 Tax=Hespellia stercorisuis TaxID=180311 RepID=A0A1M6TXD3_9FIRM|nr:ComF family protein [Hespellia stercorisuis]SHK61705.1 comF family protein [Hespellia stercorisuis DSM 15480]